MRVRFYLEMEGFKNNLTMKNYIYYLFFALITFSSCASLINGIEQRDAYEMKLSNVELDLCNKSTELKSSIKNVIGIKGYNISNFRDSIIDTEWMFNPSYISLKLKNNAKHSIKILWNECSFTDIENNTQRIFHNGVKIIDRTRELPPTFIPKRASINECIIPNDYVDYSTYFNRWMFNFFFDKREGRKEREEVKDKTMTIALTIEYNGNPYEYLFTFNVDWLEKRGYVKFDNNSKVYYINSTNPS